MITSNIESNNVHITQIESIQVNRVAQVSPHAILLWPEQKEVSSNEDPAKRDDISGSDTKCRLTTVASIVQGLHRRLISLLHIHHTSSLMYRPCYKPLDKGRKPCNAQFSILTDERTLQTYGNASSSRPKVAIRTRPHVEMHCIIPW